MSAKRTAATELAPVEPWDEGEPCINAPAVFGAGSATCLPVPALGERPLRFRAEGLPAGLHLDEHTGVIAGRADRAGETTIRVTATNAHGTDEKAIQLVVVGRLGRGEVRENRLTRDEQITHITLWALLAAPMLIGCDMTGLDDFTLRLLCNDEMLQVNQDPLGRQGWCLREVRRADPSGRPMHHAHVYVRPLHDGALAVGFFNRGPEAATVEVTWAELEIEGTRNVRDIWARKDVGRAEDRLAVDVPPHGAQFMRISG